VSSIARLERVGAVAVVTVDNPPVNTIDAGVRAALFDVVAQLQAAIDVQAVVFLCAGRTFISGADINEFSGPSKEAEYRRLWNSVEALPVPVVVAMHGMVLGGGLEFSLACHYRIAAPNARFGLPEVTLGIIPGAGGTQRLPRLIGVEKALELVISARQVDAPTAVNLGIVDGIVEGDLRTGAIAYAEDLVAHGAGPRRTGEHSIDPATATAEIFDRAKATARKLYPGRQAALTAVEAVAASVRLPLQAGLEYETELVNAAKETAESKGAVHVFFAERAARKVPGLPVDAQARAIRSGAVVGAGTMGGGIAICFANAGLPVTLLDASADVLRRGLASVGETYDSMVARGRLTPEEKAKRMALISGSLDYVAIADADVVIEAVFEDLDLKRKIFADLDRVMKPGAVLATSTSTLDIGRIATATRRPQDVVGLHFASPADVMPLLEVVRTGATSPSTIRTAMELAKPLKKRPVLVKACYGFVGDRMMEGYAREAERIVLEGATPRRVDSALEKWGMAMGVLAVFDRVGIDVRVNVCRANADKYPPDPTYCQADVALHAAGRMGRKNGKGYYRYVPGDRTRHDDPEAIEILRAKARELGVPQKTHTDEEIVERCLYPLLNEGLRILEEGVALRAADVDVVWTSGYGFPRWRGGPMFHVETIGLKTLYDGMLKYRAQFGPMHWEPAKLLEQLATSGRTLKDWEASRVAGVA
jgi:3-hydroxyacyl-CoA dehydrogenase